MAELTLVYTRFAGTHSVQGEVIYSTLAELASQAVIKYKDKRAQPLLVPDYLENDSRAHNASSLLALSIFLDIDKPVLSYKEVSAVLRKYGAAFVAYPTFSWKADEEKYRIALPLSRPIELYERLQLQTRIAEVIPGISLETFQHKRGYFIGRNCTKDVPAPITHLGQPADIVAWPQTARPVPRPLTAVQSRLMDNPFSLAQERVAHYNRKLKDGEGRWECVEYAATRMAARGYPDDKAYTWLGDLIARYFDNSDVTPANRKQWESRVAYWLSKDLRKRTERLKPDIEERKMPEGLPSTFSLEELIDMKLPDTKWIVEDLLPPGLALLAGPPKLGKSQLALSMALDVASGKPVLGRYASHKSTVLYYDLESGHHLLKERIVPLMRAKSLTVKDIKGCFGVSLVLDSGADAFKQIRIDIKDNPEVKLIIVDIFAKIRDAAESRRSAYQLDYEAMSGFQDICLEHPELCILLVHHTNKRANANTDHWQDRISGTAGLAGGTHTNFVLDRISKQGLQPDEYELLKNFAVFFAAGKRVKEIDLVLEKAPNGLGEWLISDLKAYEVTQTSSQKAIMDTLRSDPARLWSSTEVAAVLGKSSNTMKEIMRRMASRGEIVSPTGKGYTLPSLATTEKTRKPRTGRPAGRKY